MSENKRVVITGIGVVESTGPGAKSCRDVLHAVVVGRG
jgi:hypothetical protein